VPFVEQLYLRRHQVLVYRGQPLQLLLLLAGDVRFPALHDLGLAQRNVLLQSDAVGGTNFLALPYRLQLLHQRLVGELPFICDYIQQQRFEALSDLPVEAKLKLLLAGTPRLFLPAEKH